MTGNVSSVLPVIRDHIGQLDNELVNLLCDRQALVWRASLLKKDEEAVRAPHRIEEIITRVRILAEEQGASPDLFESLYRSMISTYVNYELSESVPRANSATTQTDGTSGHLT